MKFSTRRTLWQLVSKLPYFIRRRLILSSVEAKHSDLKDFVFKRAETQDELEQSFALLYESYKQDGLMDENEIKMRITKYHALPTTVILIAKLKNEVVGTVTHILDGPFGLPTEEICSVQEFRNPNHRIAEISSLTIKKNFRRNKSLLFGLTRYLYTYATHLCGIKYWVISTRTTVRDYYTAIFGFKTIVKNAKYHFVNGVECAGLVCDLENNANLFKKIYGHKSGDKNLHAFYTSYSLEEIGEFPEKNSLTSVQYSCDKNLLNYFYNEKTDLFTNLNEKEKLELINRDVFSNYQDVMGEYEIPTATSKRNSARIATYIDATLYNTDEKVSTLTPITLIEVSKNGFLIRTDKDLLSNKSMRMQFRLKEAGVFTVPVVINCKRADNSYVLTAPDKTTWAAFYQDLAHANSAAQTGSGDKKRILRQM